MHNTQILTDHADRHPVTNEEVVENYLHFCEIGGKHGVTPCFEAHVNMWSEDFPVWAMSAGRFRHRA